MANEQLSSLTLILSPTKQIAHPQQVKQLGPNLQGVLMEHISSEFAATLHQLPFNPYSQHCIWKGDNLAWHVNALSNDATSHIIEPLRHLDRITVRKHGLHFEVTKTALATLNLKSLVATINETGDDRVNIRFVTPTSFKSKGTYVIMPSVRLIFQNLLMHYGQVYDNSKEGYEETIDYMDQNVRVISYNLRSSYFDNIAVGQRRIPAFVGTMTLSLRGPIMVAGLARMLLKFGEFAGVGIKTSMGMGGFTCFTKHQRAD